MIRGLFIPDPDPGVPDPGSGSAILEFTHLALVPLSTQPWKGAALMIFPLGSRFA
jgi:hypothetical protein